MAHINETKLLREDIEKLKAKYENGQENTMETVPCVQILEIPCNTLDDLLAFEAKLQDDSPTLYAFENLMAKMPYITLQKYLSGCLKYCINDSVANKCSWEGKNNNLAVGDFTLINVIQECAQKKFPEARLVDIITIMRKWFHYAKDRCRRKFTKEPLSL